VILAALALALAAPAQPAPPTCTAPDGTVITLELALTGKDRAMGLMFRESLPASSGMLFVFEENGIYPFWMKNTYISLDLVWLDPSGKVVEVRERTEPCHRDPCRQYEPKAEARAVLELNGGAAAAHGIVPGAALVFSRVPGYPIAGGAE